MTSRFNRSAQVIVAVFLENRWNGSAKRSELVPIKSCKLGSALGSFYVERSKMK